MSVDGQDTSVQNDYDDIVGESGDEEEEEDEDDDDDDDDNKSPNLVRLLNEFRNKWQQELGLSASENGFVDARGSGDVRKPMTTEDMARAIFEQGIAAEQTGRLGEAVGFYRRAIQMVPDIEAKIDYRNFIIPNRDRTESESSIESTENDDENSIKRDDNICHPLFEQKGTHISSLPVELMMIILKWVVSDDLDLYSLEMFSMVCHSWYRYARDEDLWKRVCTRLWGANRGSRKHYKGSWRNMYIDRPHLRFNGLYISKCSYLRQGEKGIYDFFNPWHRVDYYRYMRFFPDGVILMLTSPEDPLSMVGKLRSRDSHRQGLLKGYYKMTGNTMTALLRRVETPVVKSMYRYRRYRNNNNNHNQNHVDQTFYVEFAVVSSGKKRCSRLMWTKYTIRTCRSNGEVNESEFELSPKNYPPLFFSGVRSYTALSGGPLT